MKNTIFYLFVFVFGSCVYIKKSSSVQFDEAIVELNNGEKLAGKVSFPLLEEDTKLKIKQNNKTKKIKKNEIAKVTFKSSVTNVEYYNLSYKDYNDKIRKNKKMMSLNIKGKINLYTTISISMDSYTDNFMNKSSRIKFKQKIITDYYCKKENEEVATLLYRKLSNDQKVVNKNYPFKERAIKYFADNQEIRQKIENEEFNYNNITDLINFYNSK